MTTIPTKRKLASLLNHEGLTELAVRAERGDFDDYESESPTPCHDLVEALEAAKRHDLADRARNGEFDATAEEAAAWMEREGKAIFGGGQ